MVALKISRKQMKRSRLQKLRKSLFGVWHLF